MMEPTLKNVRSRDLKRRLWGKINNDPTVYNAFKLYETSDGAIHLEEVLVSLVVTLSDQKINILNQMIKERMQHEP